MLYFIHFKELIFLTNVVMTFLDTEKRKQTLLKFSYFSSIWISHYFSDHKDLRVLCRDVNVLLWRKDPINRCSKTTQVYISFHFLIIILIYEENRYLFVTFYLPKHAAAPTMA